MLNPKKEIETLKHGEFWTWPESDYGKAETYKLHGIYLLFEIPLFGGELLFHSSFSNVIDLVTVVESWT